MEGFQGGDDLLVQFHQLTRATRIQSTMSAAKPARGSCDLDGFSTRTICVKFAGAEADVSLIPSTTGLRGSIPFFVPRRFTMPLSKLALTCVIMMAGQASPSDMVYTNLRAGQIPAEFTLPNRREEVREMHLYMSADKGASWNLIDRITPNKGSFTYNVGEDGEFWFHVVVINQQGLQEPKNLYNAPPKMKMIVDTRPPMLKIVSAERQGDEMVVSWEVQEQYPDAQTLKMEYRTADSQTWVPVTLSPSPVGTKRVPLNTPAPVVVRMRLKDLAGNEGQTEASVAGGVAVAGYTNPGGPGVAKAPQPAPSAEPPSAPTLPSPGSGSVPPLAGSGSVPPPPGSGSVPPPPVTDKQPSLTLPGNEHPIPPASAGQGQVVASSKDNSQGSPVPPPTAPAAGQHQAPALQVVNERELLLEYEVSKVGPSGIGSVEVWMTRDGGAKWAQFAVDPDAPQATSGGKYQRTLELPGDGVYGISLVVKSKAGLGKAAPRPGDAPEMLIEVDTVPPEAQLLSPVPDPTKRDTLILSWIAKDRNLGPTPIVLEWAAQAQGPWQTIHAGLANTGRFAWQLPATLPSHVYLKLTVRDTAGNVAVAVTREPQLVDLSEPEGHLIRVAPVSRKN
jgi:hypothetical protein